MELHSGFVQFNGVREFMLFNSNEMCSFYGEKQNSLAEVESDKV